MKKNVLIIGKGSAGELLCEELINNEKYNFLGFIDDYKYGVLGKIKDLEHIVGNTEVDIVYIAMPSVDKAVIKKIRNSLFKFDVAVKLLPSYVDIIHGNVSINKTKSIDIGDILGRPPVKSEYEKIKKFIKDKVVLITGAAGSIGSELSKQVAICNPTKIICFDKAETPLFHLQSKLSDYSNVQYIIGDICNEEKMNRIFDSMSIDIVLHAAAYKHVPLLENNYDEAINNNINGSNILLKIACQHNTPNVLIISTDKAVNPTNIMGATKRVVEKLMEYYSFKFPKTKISAVRFGNVLKSNGSVVNIFEEKIRKGESLPVTHIDIVRYFMTVQEAAQLILLAVRQGRENEIFVLDMGKPMKILNLAEEMIRLYGLKPYEDIDINIVGLRPGEKLYEELLLKSGTTRKTEDDKVYVTYKEEDFDLEFFYDKVISLVQRCGSMKKESVYEELNKLVPTFKTKIVQV